jgi:hypothetical protein
MKEKNSLRQRNSKQNIAKVAQASATAKKSIGSGHLRSHIFTVESVQIPRAVSYFLLFQLNTCGFALYYTNVAPEDNILQSMPVEERFVYPIGMVLVSGRSLPRLPLLNMQCTHTYTCVYT